MIEYKNVTKEDILENPTIYTEALKAEGVIAFRQLGLTRDEFQDVTHALGMVDSPIVQDVEHKTRFDHIAQNYSFTSGGIFLAWHLEDTYKEHLPQIIALNMHTFQVPHESDRQPGGQTGFVDMHQCYNSMPDDWKEALKDACMLEAQVTFLPTEIFHYPHKLFKEDPISGKIVVFAQGHTTTPEPPYQINPDTCPALSEEDVSNVNQWIQDFVYTEENQQWYSWLEGDLILFCGVRYAHAVSLGFQRGQRIFDRAAFHGGNKDAYVVPAYNTFEDEEELFRLVPKKEEKRDGRN